MLLVILIAVSVTSWISGFLIGASFQRKYWWVSLLINGLAFAAILVMRRWVCRQIEELDRQRNDMRRGEAGENRRVAGSNAFLTSFFAIHDLATPSGNLDHVVIGPTGVFAIDAKGWKGVVSAVTKGELLFNNQPTDKPFVKQFVGRVMGIKERLKALAPGMDAYIQAVFVFTSARVEAKWGATGAVHCVRDEQLYDYIVGDKRGRKLSPKEAKTIAQAFLALARMDADFADRAMPKTPPVSNETAQQS